NTGLRSDVVETPAAPVVVQAMPGACIDASVANGTTVHEKDVHPPVVVVVEEHAAAAHDFWQVALGARTVCVPEIKTGRSGHLLEAGYRKVSLRRWPRRSSLCGRQRTRG